MRLKICTVKKADGIECSFSEVLESEPEVIEWEHKAGLASPCDIANGDILAAILDGWGKDGWELVQILPTDRGLHRAIFKRRRRTEPEQSKCCECEGQESKGETC